MTESNYAATGPLTGLRVLALEQAVAGPLCTRHLADLGAEVIKIERPGCGDFARRYDTSVRGLSSYFCWLNRGKRSLTLDMPQPAARDVLERLISKSDILVQNLGPGAIDRLGFAPERLRWTVYPVGHTVTPQMEADVVDGFVTHLAGLHL